MSSIPVTELDLISALQAVGALNKSDETSRLFESKSTLNDAPMGTASSIWSDSFPIFERSESLRIIHNLVEGLLRVQTRDSSTATRHLGVVLSSLFRFLSDSNSDVRIAADEGLNKLIKFLRSSMTHLILFELLMELKRNQNSRSVSAALSKFAALSPQIRTSKRRFYAINLLPILVSICEQEDDLLFENLIDSFRPIAIELFYYANEKELRNFIRSQFTRLSSDSALVRRSIAQLLVITCQSSRAPLTLLRYLLHLILTEMDSLIENSQSEPIKVNCDKSPSSFSSTAYWTGLFNAVRYLSIGWDQFSKNFTKSQTFLDLNMSPPSSSRLDILNTVHSTLIDTENPELPNPDDSISLSFNHHSPNTEVDSPKTLSKMSYLDFDNRLWSKAFFMCLHHASNLSTSNSLMVQTASLEAFVQLLTVRRPFFLFPQSWLRCVKSCSPRSSSPASSFNHYSNFDKANNDRLEDNVISELSTDQYKLHKNKLRIDSNIFKESDDFVPTNQFSRTFSLESVDNKSSSSDFQSVDNRDTFFIRSASSSSLISSVKVDLNETVLNDQEIQNQLSIVRAQLARDEGKSMNNKNDDIFSDLGYDIIYDSSRNAESTQTDESHDSLIGNDHIRGQESASVYFPKFYPLNLVDLISRLSNQDEPINLSQTDWLLPFLLLSFDMMPSTQKTSTMKFQWPRPLNSPRTSLHLLVINCLAQLAQLNPIIFFVKLNGNQCCSDDQLNMEEVHWPTANDVILEFLNNSTDPQLQGQLCILIGNLIASYLVWRNLNYHEFDCVFNNHKFDEYATLEHLFIKLESYLNINVSGITLRWALSGLRTCSNVLLSCADRDSSLHPNRSDVSSDKLLVYRFLKALTSIVIHASRHPYRLVRRELLILVIELDWASIGYLEGTLKTLEFAQSPLFSVKPTRLIDLTWIECWRILCDSDPDLRHKASIALISLASNLTSGIGDHLGISTGGLLPNRIDRSLRYWLSQPYSQTKSKVSCYSLVGSLGVHGLPPCLSTLPMEMDVGPTGRQFYQSQMSQLLCMESENNKASNEVTIFRASSTGATRLFRDCLTALMELPCSSFLPEDHYMLFGVVGCLNQLIGFSHLLSHSHLWFDSVCVSSLASSESTSSNENPIQPTRRRSRLSLLSWHCLTLLSSAPITSIDLELQSSLLNLCTGCVIHNQQPFTRFALAFMQHLMRVCCVLWHVLEAIPIPQHSQFDSVTTKIPISSIYSGISESFMHSVANLAQTGNNFSMSKVNQETITSTATTGNSGISSTDTSSKKRNYGTKLSGSLRKHLSIPRYSPTFTSSLGYFANLPQYISLYKTLKVAYKSFKISSDLSGSNDRLMNLLQTCLHSFGRLLENLHFNEIAPYADELLVYLTSFYNWKPGPCLELSTQLLRAFVGTNLCSQWDDQLSQLYSDALNFSFYRQDSNNEKETYSRIGVQNTISLHIRKLLDQNKTSTNYLWDQSILDENKACCWIAIPELRQAPISAWIRFARQRRIPVGLEYANNTDRALAATSSQTTAISALRIKPDVQSFFKRLEHIVLRGMETYKWINCYALQAGILDLLIHLIYLRMDYCQLDVQQKFLNIVVNHCENLASEMQRLETITTMNVGSLNCHYFKGNHQLNLNKRLTSSGLSTSIIRECSSFSLFLFPMVNLRAPSVLQQHERLVNAIFRFLITLTYQHRIIPSSSTSQQPTSTPTQTKHVDSGSSENSAASSTSTTTESENSVGSRFVELSQVVHLAEALAAETRDPGSVVLTAMVPVIVDLFVIQQPLSQRTNKQAETIDQTRRHQIQQANAQRETILSFLLRRIGHLPASYDQISLILEEVNLSSKICRSENNIIIIDCLIQILLDNCNPLHFIRWTVKQCFCSRFLFHLFSRIVKLSESTNFDISKRITKLFEYSLITIHQIISAIKVLLLSEPHMIGQIVSLEFDCSVKSTNLILLIHLSLTCLLNLIELVKSEFCINIVWNNQHTTSLIQAIHKQIYSIGKFEPLICLLWHQLVFSKEVNIVDILLENYCTKSLSDNSDKQHSNNILSKIVLPNGFMDCSWTSINQELVNQSLVISYIQSQLNSNNIDIIVQNLLSPPLSDLRTSYSYQKKIIRLLNMWHSGEPIVCNLMSQLSNSKDAFKQIIHGFMDCLSLMSLEQIRFILNNMFDKIHAELATYQFDTLLNKFIVPHCEVLQFEKNKHCSTCIRSFMPISLRLIASIKACNILEWILKNYDDKSKDPKCMISHDILLNYRLRLTTCGHNLKANQLISLLDRLIKYTKEKPDQSEDYTASNPLPHCSYDSVIKLSNETGWLLNSAKDLVKQCDLSAVLNGIRLIHALSECTNIKEKEISNILDSVCLRCSPRMLYYALVLGSSSVSSSLSPNSLSTTSEIGNQITKPGTKILRITPCVNVLFRIAQKILFRNIQNIVTNSSELFKEIAEPSLINSLFFVLPIKFLDPNLADSVQTYLTGLSFALLEFLRILPHVPLGDLVPIEKETDALSFLLILIEFFFCSMGYPYSQITSVCAGSTGFTTDATLIPSQALSKDNNDNAPKRRFMISITLMQTSLRLLNYVLQTALNRSVKGVDLFGGDGKRILSIFLLFVWMIDKSACLSEYTTVWSKSTNEHMINAVQRILDEYAQQSLAESSSSSPELSITILLNNLLIPLYPPVMGLWWPDPICASTLSDFCATVASSASYAALNSTSSISTMNQTKLGNTEGGFIQPCQLISKCRLLRCNSIQSTGLDIVNQLNMCTLGNYIPLLILGRKLMALLTLIERERNCINNYSDYSMPCITSEYMDRLDKTGDLELINLERLANPFSDGPSQFAVDRLIRRIHIRGNSNFTGWSSVDEFSKSNHRPLNILTLQDYEDPLFSCLQSLQLFYHSCLKPEPFPIRSSDNEDMNSLLLGISKGVDSLTPSTLCSYLEKKINTVFCIPMATANLLGTQTLVNQDLSVTSTTGPSGMKRLMQAVLHPGAASKVTNVERESSVMRFSNNDLTDHIEQHQLIILSTAFFLTEHFSGPPVYPILTDSGMGITEMLSGLTAMLFRLTSCMLSDVPIISHSKRTEDTKSSGLSTGTTMDLSYSFPVHMAWCQGIERLIYSGRLGKGAIGSLQKMCINRIRTCCSPHISFLAIRLLLTCIYANLGRLSDRIQHYRRIHHTQLSDHKPSNDVSNKADTNNKIDSIAVSSEGTSDTMKPISKISDSFPPESLPSSILQDSENIAALTQESLNCLWEKLRGGVSLVNSSIQHTHRSQISCPMSAWTSVIEARLIARLLPLISNDVTQTVISLLNTSESVNKQLMLSPSIIGCDSLPNSVLNKALGEFARSDHSFPNLAASNLTQCSTFVVGKIKLNRANGIFLCYTYKLTTTESKSLCNIPTDNNSSLAITSNSSVYLSDLLCLAAYHFVTDGLLKPLIKSESEILLYNKRQAERNHFLTLIKDHCDAISDSNNNNTGTPTTTTTTNPAIKYGDNSYSTTENSTVFHQLYTIIKQQVANNSS
ncbi:Huntingtin [Schistosoma japonicum]|nr:Huntingtin [Schistosoma japonicum]